MTGVKTICNKNGAVLMLAWVLLLAPGTNAAAPTGADLLSACNQALEDGFDSIEGMLCAWYVTPCDCHVDTEVPKVCLPDTLPVESLAQQVVNGITNQNELRDMEASLSAANILSVIYPCQNEQDAGQTVESLP